MKGLVRTVVCALAILALGAEPKGCGVDGGDYKVNCPPTQAPNALEPSGTIGNQRPTFSWTRVAGATSYTLYVLRVSDEKVLLRKTGIRGLSYTALNNLPIGVRLRWKVKGESSCGPGPYTPSVYFQINDGSDNCPPTRAPEALEPSGTISNPRPIFRWTGVDGATSYTLYVLRVSDEEIMLRQTDISGLSYAPQQDLPGGVELRWKVKGESSCGPGPYSPSIHFRIESGSELNLEIVSPGTGETVTGTVDVAVSAPTSVNQVEFYLDGVLVATDAAAPFEYSLDTSINPLPEPNHAMGFGYYFVEWKNPAMFEECRAEVADYTNMYYASLSSYVSDATDQWIPLLSQSLADAYSEGRRIHLNVELSVPAFAQRLGEVLDATAPYWDRVMRIEVADEPNWSQSEMESQIQTVHAALNARGLEVIGVKLRVQIFT